MKKYLLDTQVFLWIFLESSRFSTKGRAFVQDTKSSKFYVSHVSAWEICIKYGVGKLKLPKPPEILIPELVFTADYKHLPISLAHILAGPSLPRIHGDPFDRMLVCQAKIEGLTLVTADRVMKKYGVPTLARAGLF